MLISHRYNFIFIHTYKTAGMSITHALMPFAVNRYQQKLHQVTTDRGKFMIAGLLSRLGLEAYPEPYQRHIKASELISEIGISAFKSYYSFAFVRNPWDWQVSLYKYMLRSSDHRQYELVRRFDGFDEYIHWRCAHEIRYQKEFVCSEEGEVLVDFVGRYESLNSDFDAICSHLGISASLPKLNASNRGRYQEYYNEETKELVRRAFAPDIHFFDYDFE